MRMLQGCPGRPAPRRRFLVVSLLTKTPTSAAELGAATHTHDREPAPGVTTRARRRRIAAAAALSRLPEEILVSEIFVRLPAKDILRCRAVCRSWRGLTSAANFLLAHHRRQPSLPLLTLCGTASTNGALPIFERALPILGFDDDTGLKIHASCDGLLLLGLSYDCFSICNPATRQCAALPGLAADGRISIKAMYRHYASCEYRVLYSKWSYTKLHPDAAYYILALLQGGSPRCIPITTSDSPADMDKVILAVAGHNMTQSDWAPPVVFRNNLHWNPDFLHEGPDIVVFDTEVESFRFMCRPAAATRFCTRLCDMKGFIGFSCFDNDKTVAKIWVLEDYEREVWSFKYHVKFPVESLCNLQDTQHLVLSPEGDMLVYSDSSKPFMFHCDNAGKLVQEFRWESPDPSMIVHWFKESLVKHEFFPTRGGARASWRPNFFP